MEENELRRRVVRRAESLLGLQEADGSHRRILEAYNSIAPLPRGYRMRSEDPWCAAFVSAVGQMEGLSAVLLPECACEAMLALYRARGLARRDSGGLRPGDLVFYDWDGDAIADHVGLAAGTDGDGIEVIEGNSGDAVRRRRVPRDWPFLCGFACPDYASAADLDGGMTPEAAPEEVPDTAVFLPTLAFGARGESVRAMQGILIARGCSCGPDGADGDFGANTAAALRRFQREAELAADGVCGAATWKQLLGVSK